MFADRNDAGKQLSAKLNHYARENVVILAIPRGGLPVASVVARALRAPLDVALIKKLGHPFNKEYAIGAISLNNVVLGDTLGVSERYIKEETQGVRDILKKRYDQYYKNNSPQNLKDKTVIVIDDGIATGNTLMATVQLVKEQQAAKIVVAIPVAPKMAITKFEDTPLVDEVVCLSAPFNFQAVGQFYKKFNQLTDEEAIAILKSANTQ
ncbi:MAG: phosphoribosyltransferase [Flavobacteriaceae bacterium]